MSNITDVLKSLSSSTFFAHILCRFNTVYSNMLESNTLCVEHIFKHYIFANKLKFTLNKLKSILSWGSNKSMRNMKTKFPKFLIPSAPIHKIHVFHLPWYKKKMWHCTICKQYACFESFPFHQKFVIFVCQTTWFWWNVRLWTSGVNVHNENSNWYAAF